MIFAQFYQLSTGYPTFKEEDKTIIEVCGDRGVIVLDGRQQKETHYQIAQEVCKKRGYIGYSIHKGETFNRSVKIKEYTPI